MKYDEDIVYTFILNTCLGLKNQALLKSFQFIFQMKNIN